jgi:hypothetical protein
VNVPAMAMTLLNLSDTSHQNHQSWIKGHFVTMYSALQPKHPLWSPFQKPVKAAGEKSMVVSLIKV